MFSIINYLLTNIKNWKQALALSFLSYFIVLVFIIVVITFSLQDFRFSIIAAISIAYMGSVIVMLLLAAIIFKKRLIER